MRVHYAYKGVPSDTFRLRVRVLRGPVSVLQLFILHDLAVTFHYEALPDTRPPLVKSYLGGNGRMLTFLNCPG